MCCQGVTLQSSQAVSNAKRLGWPLSQVEDSLYMTEGPGGYRFYLIDKDQPDGGGCLSALFNEKVLFYKTG